MVVTKVSLKGQIVIPKALREKYGIKPESRVLIAEINGRIAIVPLLENPVKEARGILKGGRSLTRTLLAERRAEREREEKVRAR